MQTKSSKGSGRSCQLMCTFEVELVSLCPTCTIRSLKIYTSHAHEKTTVSKHTGSDYHLGYHCPVLRITGPIYHTFKFLTEINEEKKSEQVNDLFSFTLVYITDCDEFIFLFNWNSTNNL